MLAIVLEVVAGCGVCPPELAPLTLRSPPDPWLAPLILRWPGEPVLAWPVLYLDM